MHQNVAPRYPQSEGEDTWPRTLFEGGYFTIYKLPFRLENGRTQHRG